jgi:hypothetical protein
VPVSPVLRRYSPTMDGSSLMRPECRTVMVTSGVAARAAARRAPARQWGPLIACTTWAGVI